MAVSFPLTAQGARNSVERAIAEWRAGRPVWLRGTGGSGLAATIETLDEAALQALAPFGVGARLVLPARRLRRLGFATDDARSVALPSLDMARIERLALSLKATLDAQTVPVDALDMAALELARISQTLPAVLVLPLTDTPELDVLSVEVTDLMAYRKNEAAHLAIVARAPVPLERAARSEFVVFRGGEGLRDQVAVIVGEPDLSQAVPVRLHSACLTGDLFGSLKCDCGDQLRGTVGWMADNGGGILLYLDQEGRGNGISNKMRAYALQAKGFDTYEADEALGFGLDGRRFDFAARMLRLLGVRKIEIMTNNPLKIAALKQAGLDVVAERRVIGRASHHNVGYLATKQQKAGHMLDGQSLMRSLKPQT